MVFGFGSQSVERIGDAGVIGAGLAHGHRVTGQIIAQIVQRKGRGGFLRGGTVECSRHDLRFR